MVGGDRDKDQTDKKIWRGIEVVGVEIIGVEKRFVNREMME